MITLEPAPTQSPIGGKERMPALWESWFSKLVSAFNSITTSGTTGQRPNPTPYVGFMYYDTTINKPIWASSSSTWVYADGTGA